MSKLFVGGLSWNTDDISLRDAFGAYGQVVDAIIIKDRETGKSHISWLLPFFLSFSFSFRSFFFHFILVKA